MVSSQKSHPPPSSHSRASPERAEEEEPGEEERAAASYTAIPFPFCALVRRAGEEGRGAGAEAASRATSPTGVTCWRQRHLLFSRFVERSVTPFTESAAPATGDPPRGGGAVSRVSRREGHWGWPVKWPELSQSKHRRTVCSHASPAPPEQFSCWQRWERVAWLPRHKRHRGGKLQRVEICPNCMQLWHVLGCACSVQSLITLLPPRRHILEARRAVSMAGDLSTTNFTAQLTAPDAFIAATDPIMLGLPTVTIPGLEFSRSIRRPSYTRSFVESSIFHSAPLPQSARGTPVTKTLTRATSGAKEKSGRSKSCMSTAWHFSNKPPTCAAV